MLLVCCALQPSTIGSYNLCIVLKVAVGINHNAVEHSCFRVFAFYIQIVTWNIAVEDTLWDIQLGRFLSHTPK